jgi:hypothetical protein
MSLNSYQVFNRQNDDGYGRGKRLRTVSQLLHPQTFALGDMSLTM